ncbi:MAG: hypothetical protein RIS50_1708 [Bacteroidota bacterium]
MEYTDHHGVHRTTEQQVDFCLTFVGIPEILHVRENRCIHVVEFLKLIDDDGELSGFRNFQEKAKHRFEGF